MRYDSRQQDLSPTDVAVLHGLMMLGSATSRQLAIACNHPDATDVTAGLTRLAGARFVEAAGGSRWRLTLAGGRLAASVYVSGGRVLYRGAPS